MAKISLAGFKDPVRRPRFIIWTGVAVVVMAAVMIVALGVTSTRWFCSEGCHKVQDDTILAYEASAHSNVSCMACHMPVNANPVVFILHKAEALGELYLTVRNDFELPLNAHSHVALTMPSEQCTQCHNMKNRKVTPSEGVKIDHAVHEEINTACPVCHNRVAHVEDFELTLTDPKTKEKNKPHQVFTSMTACFRCHGLEKAAAAPGRCSACHPADFELKPDNHREKDFFPGGHAELAVEYREESEKAKHVSDEGEGEGKESGEGEKETGFLGPEKAYASGGGSGKEPVAKEDVPKLIAAYRNGEHGKGSIGEELPPTESVFYCSTCHTDNFCGNCHGMEMPHPAAFREPKGKGHPEGHPSVSKQQSKKCVMCHGENAKTHFCDSCHHGKKVGDWEFKTNVPWTDKQHPQAVGSAGVNACTDSCHETKFCVTCHDGKKVYPASHKAGDWTKPKSPGAVTKYGKSAAKPTAKHSVSALESMESCEVCHGSGGANGKFCQDCHKLEMPHPAQFKENHVSGKKNVSACANCHLLKEVCSNCHHVGSSLDRPWIQVHGGSSNKNGASGCVEKCHTKDDCVKCHTARKVVPASHKPGNFVRDFSSKDAAHVRLYNSNGEICTYCHKGKAAELPTSKFCTDCHKLPMPHRIDEGEKQKFAHKADFNKKKLSKSTCNNCHRSAFCNDCHHEGSTSSKPWERHHPSIVKKNGAEPCFECHQPTFCANCHVNLAKKGFLN